MTDDKSHLMIVNCLNEQLLFKVIEDISILFPNKMCIESTIFIFFIGNKNCNHIV